MFVKPANLGSSVGVTKAHDIDELRAAIDHARRYDEYVVVEEAVDGREIEVAVLGNESPRASVPGEIVPGREFYDYDDKYLTDGADLLVPADLGDDEIAEVQHLAIAAYRALRVDGMARVDFFYEEGRPGLAGERAQHDPGLHSDLDVPEAVGGLGCPLRASSSTSSCAWPSSATTAARASPPTTEIFNSTVDNSRTGA